jgi:hypothetical protein
MDVSHLPRPAYAGYGIRSSEDDMRVSAIMEVFIGDDADQ